MLNQALSFSGLKTNYRIICYGFLLATAFAWISGCATPARQEGSEAIVKTIVIEPVGNAQSAPAADFNLLGRISIQSRNQNFSGSFRWRHLAIGDEILLFTSLGQTIAEIARDHNGFRLITAKLEAFYANDAESLTEEILGWRLPLNGLQYWIQGIHSPVTVAEKDLNNKNQVIAMRQDGWVIQYLSYMPTQPNVPAFPRVLSLNYEDLKLRLVIDNWNTE